MEYVEGETLGNLIKRCGRLDPKIALEIISQVAAGSAAVHDQKLVHRDIKPTNIMVSLKDESRLITKIIDLGLAKPVADAPTAVAISSPGACAGTREFASPEQFAGIDVDIRSDLYSLGIVLWEMVTGGTPFRGSAGELMYQHQHTPLPLEQLKSVPKPVVTLLEMLLEKDPARRFQNPTEMLKAMPAIAGAIEAGVGKSTLINHWLRRMAAEHYRSAELVFGWSFYRQGTSGETSSADEFLNAALDSFGDPDPRLGTGWEKGERLAKLVADRRTLLILDGLEPLQIPPGSEECRLRDPALQALLRELAAFNKGLCVITTRTPVADIADHERTSALRRNLEELSRDAGAKLLRALGVKGDETALRTASAEFSGHCLALTLLGSYLNDAYDGDIRCLSEVTGRLTHDE